MPINKAQKDKEKLPNWNLGDLYLGISDKKIKEDLAKIESAIKEFTLNFRNQINAIDAEKLYNAIAEYQDIAENIGKIGTFAYLSYAGDLSNQETLAFFQNISEEITKFESELVFFGLEINNIENDKISKMLSESANLSIFKPFIDEIRLFKPYQLEEKLEKIIIDKAVSGRSSWVRLFDETINNLKFQYGKKILNSQEIFDLTSNHNESTRKRASKAIGKTFSENSKTFSFITNILAKDKAIDDEWRGFNHPISSRNLSNAVEDKVVETLINTVKNNYSDISHRYYKIKAKMLGKEKLNYWDRNAPLSNVKGNFKGNVGNKKISFKDAKTLVLDAYQKFSPQMAELGKQFFEKNWIDAEVRNGKDSGAFSHPCVPSVHPYILLNYQGKIRDIMTLAHELGHGVHQILAGKQGFLMSQTPLTLAETASVFGEQLTFQEILINQKNSQQKKLIIANKVEDMINTVIRQIAFLDFETKVHNARKNGEIPLETICKFWLEVQQESLGDGFNFDEEYKFFWCYIPHFIHSPFYVYAYAFGDCLVNSLYGVYQSKKVANFSDKYIKMLESGGTKHHKELLSPFGLDASKADFWQSGLDVIINYINQIEE